MLPGIPLALVSIAAQVLIATFGILTAFQQIATQQRTGVRNVAGSMAAVTGSFTTAICLSIGCVVALVVLQVLRDRRDEQRAEAGSESGYESSGEPAEPNGPKDRLAPRIAFFLTTISALAAMGLLWFFERTLDVIMLISDTRKAEAQERLGSAPIGELAGLISRPVDSLRGVLLRPPGLFFTAPFWLFAGEGPEWVRESHRPSPL